MNTMRWSEPATPHDDGGPPTIKNHSVTHFQGHLYCFGGYDGRRNHMTLLLYSIQEQLWIPTRQNPSNNTSSSSSARVDGDDAHSRLAVYSSSVPGNSSSNNNINNSNSSNSNNNPFLDATHEITVSGTSPPGRNGHTATLATDPDDEDHGRIIIIGGWLGSGPLAASDTHVLDISPTLGLRWYQPTVQGTPPGPCNMHTADFWAESREVYVFRGGNGREYLHDLHALNVDTYRWQRVETNGATPQQRANHSSALLEETGELFIFGGWNGRERLNDIHILDIRTSTWTCPNVGGVLPHPRAGMTLTALRGQLFLFGGSGTSSKCFQDLQILDRHQMAWLDVDQQEHGRNLVALGNMYDDGFDGLGNGQSYGENRWRRLVRPRPLGMAAPNPNDEESVPTVVVEGKGPGQRAGHTATAVNRRLYVFGGSCGSDYLNDFFVLDTDPRPRAILTEPTSMELLERRLRHYFNEEEFSDVTFVVEGRRVYGHKMVLSIVSDCFQAMFTTGFRESEAGAEIEIPDCSYEAFMAMMEYIYTGRCLTFREEVSDNEVDAHIHRVVDLMELADQFFLDHLKQKCEMLLQNAVQIDTVEYLRQVALKTNASQLLAICDHFERNRALQLQQQQEQQRRYRQRAQLLGQNEPNRQNE